MGIFVGTFAYAVSPGIPATITASVEATVIKFSYQVTPSAVQPAIRSTGQHHPAAPKHS